MEGQGRTEGAAGPDPNPANASACVPAMPSPVGFRPPRSPLAGTHVATATSSDVLCFVCRRKVLCLCELCVHCLIQFSMPVALNDMCSYRSEDNACVGVQAGTRAGLAT